MPKTMEGFVAFAIFEKEDTFNYVPEKGPSKLLRSVKVRLPHGDGTITRESLSVPDNYELPRMEPEKTYGFPCVVSVSKKSGKLTLSLRHDLKPFDAPQMG